MPFYHTLGSIPRKRHIIHRKPDGGMYYEHLMGCRGFGGPATLMYHINRPTTIKATRLLKEVKHEADPEVSLRMRHFQLTKVPAVKSSSIDRTTIMFNSDCVMSIAQPTETEPFFYRNAQADEIVYISDGEGILESQMGNLPYRRGDYVVVPRGIHHRFRSSGGLQRFFITESTSHVRPCDRYRNEAGQLMEHSPYCERDIRRPVELAPIDKQGDFPVIVKQGDVLTETILDHHPCDVIGWDGYYYPWALSIHDFEPIVGRLHQPPPVHQTFDADGFALCSFVPRLFDFHPEAIPCPYHHSNVACDEIIYYANEEFMSRKGIDYGSLTFHPQGLPHGPHPGKYEGSIGKKETKELAVMVDTYHPLHIAKSILPYEDKAYGSSWLETKE